MQLEPKERFPGSTKEIDAFFIAVAEADRAGRAIFAERAMPKALAKIHRCRAARNGLSSLHVIAV